MFDFIKTEKGSQGRYEARKSKVPAHIHRRWWLVHNLIAHPLIAIWPTRATFDFHDYTSDRMQGR